MSEVDHLTIIRRDLPIEFVTLDHNPTRYSVVRRQVTTNRGATGPNAGDSGAGGAAGNLGTIFHGNDPMEITLNGGLLEGEMTKMRADMLLSWLSPSSGLLGMAMAAIGSELNMDVSKPPVLIVQWGPPVVGLLLQATLTTCTVTYERVDSSGIPVRARVDMKFKENPSLLSMLPTNPTSGGRPGRTQRVVSHGETLVSIANEVYGTPSAWRPLARLNGCDDPADIKSGDLLMVPSRQELNEVPQ